MGVLRGYQDLVAWQKAIYLAEVVYPLLVKLPKEERFEMASQLRRATVSVATNIAEGAARNGSAEFIHFLGIAKGSLAEVDTLLAIAVRVNLLPGESIPGVRDRLAELRRILCGLEAGVRRHQQLPRPA